MKKLVLSIIAVIILCSITYADDCGGTYLGETLGGNMICDTCDASCNCYYFYTTDSKYYECTDCEGPPYGSVECTYAPPASIVNTPPYFYNYIRNQTTPYSFVDTTVERNITAQDAEGTVATATYYDDMTPVWNMTNYTSYPLTSLLIISQPFVSGFYIPAMYTTSANYTNKYVTGYCAAMYLSADTANAYVIATVMDITGPRNIIYEENITTPVTSTAASSDNLTCVNLKTAIKIVTGKNYIFGWRMLNSTAGYVILKGSGSSTDNTVLGIASIYSYPTFTSLIAYSYTHIKNGSINLSTFPMQEKMNYAPNTKTAVLSYNSTIKTSRGYQLGSPSFLMYYEPFNVKYCGTDNQGASACKQYNQLIYYTTPTFNSTLPTATINNPATNTLLGGTALIDGSVTLANGQIGITSMQYNITATTWANITGCDRLDTDYDCYWNLQNATIWNKTSYNVKLYACNMLGNCTNSSVKRYRIDNNAPSLKSRLKIYYMPNEAVSYDSISGRINDRVKVIVNVSDNDTIIRNILLNFTLPSNNSISVKNMTLEGGNNKALNWSWWNYTFILNQTPDTPTAYTLYYNIYDNLSNLREDTDSVIIDNQAPTYDSFTCPTTGTNITPITCTINIEDDFYLRKYIFQYNTTNDTAIELTEYYLTEDSVSYDKLFTTPGVYSVNFHIFDNAFNINRTETKEIIIIQGYENDFQINAISPQFGYSSTNPNVSFQWNYTSTLEYTADNCTLYLNEIINETIKSPSLNITNSFNKTLPTGTYDWKVSCYYNSAVFSGESRQLYITGGTGTCACPALGNWVINDGSICTLTTSCNIGNNKLIINNGGFIINMGSKLYAKSASAIYGSRFAVCPGCLVIG